MKNDYSIYFIYDENDSNVAPALFFRYKYSDSYSVFNTHFGIIDDYKSTDEMKDFLKIQKSNGYSIMEFDC